MSSPPSPSDENDESFQLQQALLARHKQRSEKVWFQNRNSLPFQCTSCGKCCKVQGDVYLSPKENVAVSNYLNISLQEFKYQYIEKEEISSGWTLLRNTINKSHPPPPRHREDESKDDNTKERCIFLNDSNICTIYPVRPVQCITYPFWPRIMNSPQSWNDEVVMEARTEEKEEKKKKRMKDDSTDDSSHISMNDEDSQMNNLISSTTITNKRWTFENGGCEGMKEVMEEDQQQQQQERIDDKYPPGISIQEAQFMLELYTRYDKSFPVGKTFTNIK